jgi:tripartite motif-containing protein 71
VDAPPAVTFGVLLRRHRVAAGLTQEELAEQAAISRRSISNMECEAPHRPRRDTVTLLAEALNLAEVDRSTFIEAAAQASRMTAVAPAFPLKRKAPGPDALRRWQLGKVRISVVAAAIALAFVLSGALIGQRLVHTPGKATTGLVPRGSFVPWGLAHSSHPGSVTHLMKSLWLAVDRQGNIYATEGSAFTTGLIPTEGVDIVKLSSAGRLLARWGRYGTHPGEFNQPGGMVVDPQRNVYVADYGNNRVQKLSPDGRTLAVWGSYGAKSGQFDLPSGLALDSGGNVYVADFGNNRIQKLSPSGKPLAVWGNVCGTRPGQFCQPSDVAVGHSGDIYVVDYGNDRIQTLSPAGRPLAAWPFPPSSSFNFPWSIAVDARGDVYVTDSADNLIHKFSSGGKVLATWAVGARDTATTGITFDVGNNLVATNDDRVYRMSSSGRSVAALPVAARPVPAQFDRPSVVTVDRHGNVYVLTASSDNSLQKLSPSGRKLVQWGSRTFGNGNTYDLAGAAVDARDDIYVSDVFSGQILKLDSAGRVLARWGGEGTGPGQFDTPYGLAVDRHGNVYVADTGNDRIQKLSPDGRSLAEWGRSGTVLGLFNAPRAVAVDGEGNVYVADTGNDRIQKLSAMGKSLAAWGVTGPSSGRFKDLTSVTVDQRGDIYAVDTVNDQVTELSPAGEVVARWGTQGARSRLFRRPQSVAVDAGGNVYVADTGNNRVEKLSRRG